MIMRCLSSDGFLTTWQGVSAESPSYLSDCFSGDKTGKQSLQRSYKFLEAGWLLQITDIPIPPSLGLILTQPPQLMAVFVKLFRSSSSLS